MEDTVLAASTASTASSASTAGFAPTWQALLLELLPATEHRRGPLADGKRFCWTPCAAVGMARPPIRATR
ncbi:hypothetical protein ACFWP3_41645 [Streptomyces sp. NPDC058525]|uniref:hypothetical protein n=1 Tax=Streptomyces sp. NPDC058525 TaxID=3346538 RepID=UPI00366200C9